MYLQLKRFCDILIAGILIVIISPLLIPVMIGLRLTGEGYIFYGQERIGFKNRKFNILKFATMLKDSPNMKGGILTTQKDPRITPMGGFLRKSKINELPQLFNIFLGDMSFVGPRPLMDLSFKAYSVAIQDKIYNVKPGLTGIGSIVFRDEEKIITESLIRGEDVWEFCTNKIYPFKGALEIWYLNNQSFIVDLKIMMITAWVILNSTSNIVYDVFKTLPRRTF